MGLGLRRSSVGQEVPEPAARDLDPSPAQGGLTAGGPAEELSNPPYTCWGQQAGGALLLLELRGTAAWHQGLSPW